MPAAVEALRVFCCFLLLLIWKDFWPRRASVGCAGFLRAAGGGALHHGASEGSDRGGAWSQGPGVRPSGAVPLSAGLAAPPNASLSNQRSNPCPLHRRVGSYPLHHEGSPEPSFDQRKLLEKVSAQTREYTERGRYALQETGKPALARGRRNSKLGRKPRPGDSWAAGLTGSLLGEEGVFKRTFTSCQGFT